MKPKHRARRAARTAADPAPDLVNDLGGQLLAAADPLAAELLAAAVLQQPHREGLGPELAELFFRTLCQVAAREPSAPAAALLRGLAAVAGPEQRREAVTALGTVTGAGHYPPEWASQIGRAQPGEAWRSYDVFGDAETIVVTFRYGEAEHAVMVQVDRCQPATVIKAAVVPDAAQVRSALDPGDDPLHRIDPIGLDEARARIEPALLADAGSQTAFPDSDSGTAISRPVIQARLRRLPAGGSGPEAVEYGPSDRAAVVAEFLASPHAAEAGEEKAARFWTEVLAGYSASIPGDPPARVGVRKLAQLLLSYVPNTFALTAEHRHTLPAAVTAWTEWAAHRQQLPEDARAVLREQLPEVLASFDAAYDDPDNSRLRGYLADLSAGTTDAGVLGEALTRRAMAVPLPDERGEDQRLRLLDAADPAHRRTVVEHEYAECDLPEGMSRPDFLAAAVRVSEELWHDDPPQRWRVARTLSAAGLSDHDVIHQLVVV